MNYTQNNYFVTTSPFLNNFTKRLTLPSDVLVFLLFEFFHFHHPLNYVLLAFSPAALPIIKILKTEYIAPTHTHTKKKENQATCCQSSASSLTCCRVVLISSTFLICSCALRYRGHGATFIN